MTILERGYRRLVYSPTPMRARLWSIVAIEWKSLFKTKWGLFAFLLCALPSIASLLLILIRFGLWEFGPPQMRQDQGESRANPFSIRFYLDPVLRESYLPFLLITTLVSCRAVARDRTAGGLELLWTRAISPWGYFLAKWSGSITLLGTLFLGCPLALWVIAVFMADDWSLLEKTAPLMPGFAIAMVMLVTVLTFLATAFSVFAGTPGFASMLWLGLILGTFAAGTLLGRIFPDLSWLLAINPWDAAKRIAEWVCGVPRLREYPVGAAVLSLCIMVMCSFLGLLRKLRTEEALAS